MVPTCARACQRLRNWQCSLITSRRQISRSNYIRTVSQESSNPVYRAMTCGYLEKRYSRGAGFDKCVTAHLDPHTNGLGFYAFILFNYFDKKKI